MDGRLPAPNGRTRRTFQPLTKPAQALNLNVRKIIERVRGGEVRVPDFQRPLRWTASDVANLFDSILKGYPIGTLLFWKRHADADPDLRIGNARINAPEAKEAWFIVDGQQRTTALAASLLDLDHDGDTRWSIRYDPDRQEFRHGPMEVSEHGRHVPLSLMGDGVKLLKWLHDSASFSDEERDQVLRAQQRILDYEIPAYIMETDDHQALRGVFARLNSTGVRMRADEVFQALFRQSGEEGEEGGGIDLEQLQVACDLDGFGQPPRAEVLKAVLAMSGLDPTRRFEELGEDALSRLVSEDDAREALMRAIEFFQAGTGFQEEMPGVGIPAFALIPYPAVFPILVRWFHLFPDTNRSERIQLSRWLWRGVASGVHQRAEVSRLRHQVRAVREDSRDESLRNLLNAVGARVETQWQLHPFDSRSARSRVEVLALLAREPMDLVSKVSWRALLTSGERMAREILPSRTWRDLDADSRKLARTAANRALLDAAYSGLRSEFLRWEWPKHKREIESHLIDEVMLENLRSDPGAFLRERANRIRSEVTAFLARRAGAGEPTVLPADWYFDDRGRGADPWP